MSELQLQYVPIGNIKPWDKNPKKHNKKAIVESIKRFKPTQPILVQKGTNLVIAGHGRLEAFKALKYDKVPIIELDMTDAEAHAYALVDNQTVINEGWDDKLLALDLQDIKLELPDLDMTTFGFSDKQTGNKKGLTDPDDVPEVQEEPITKLGDLIVLGDHRLLCGDSTKKEDVERLMGGKKADMVFTDPPYGLDRNLARGPGIDWRLTGDNPQDALKFYSIFKEYPDIERYICCSWNTYGFLLSGMGEIPDNILVWVKNNMGMGHGYRHKHEFIAYYGKKSFPDQNDVWEFSKDYSRLHPTMKPVELCEKGIINSSKEGDIVLDLFSGSGSTLIACEKTNRKCYMMELEPHYCDVIVKRWEDFTGKKAVRP